MSLASPESPRTTAQSGNSGGRRPALALVLRPVLVPVLLDLVVDLGRHDLPADHRLRLRRRLVPPLDVCRLVDVQAALLHLLDRVVVLLADVVARLLAVLLG